MESTELEHGRQAAQLKRLGGSRTAVFRKSLNAPPVCEADELEVDKVLQQFGLGLPSLRTGEQLAHFDCGPSLISQDCDTGSDLAHAHPNIGLERSCCLQHSLHNSQGSQGSQASHDTLSDEYQDSLFDEYQSFDEVLHCGGVGTRAGGQGLRASGQGGTCTRIHSLPIFSNEDESEMMMLLAHISETTGKGMPSAGNTARDATGATVMDTGGNGRMMDSKTSRGPQSRAVEHPQSRPQSRAHLSELSNFFGPSVPSGPKGGHTSSASSWASSKSDGGTEVSGALPAGGALEMGTLEIPTRATPGQRDQDQDTVLLHRSVSDMSSVKASKSIDMLIRSIHLIKREHMQEMSEQQEQLSRIHHDFDLVLKLVDSYASEIRQLRLEKQRLLMTGAHSVRHTPQAHANTHSPKGTTHTAQAQANAPQLQDTPQDTAPQDTPHDTAPQDSAAVALLQQRAAAAHGGESGHVAPCHVAPCESGHVAVSGALHASPTSMHASPSSTPSKFQLDQLGNAKIQWGLQIGRQEAGWVGANVAVSVGDVRDYGLIQIWLQELGMGDGVLKTLEQHEVDVSALAQLSTTDFTCLGITKVGWQKKLVMRAREELARRGPREA